MCMRAVAGHSFALTLCEYFPNLTKFILLHAAHLRQKKLKFNKEIDKHQWCTYSKGTIEHCEKYSDFAVADWLTLQKHPRMFAGWRPSSHQMSPA